MGQTDKILQNYREQIDTIDWEMVYLLSRRLEIVKNIWELKKENNIPLLQEDRWNSLLNTIKKDGKERWINPLLIENIWNLIHNEALKIEK